jgi:tRNA-dihydrouridine synthase B
MKLQPLILRNVTITRPLFCAPMAGITHSAFRRLVADFGGYGALFTEMLPGKALMNEKAGLVPFTKRRECEGLVWYQLALNGEEDISLVVDKLSAVAPAALDVNAACPAPEIIPRGYGAALFRDTIRLQKVLTALRSRWDGVLTVKCRIGDDTTDWKESFCKRIKIIEDAGVDAITVHPRYFNEKLRKKARWSIFDWVTSQTSLPVIANGDLSTQQDIESVAAVAPKVCGFMIGRMAVAQPWIFAQLSGNDVVIDYLSVWTTMYRYILEDFSEQKALGRLKEFTKYFAQNFLFGHVLKTNVNNALTVKSAYDVATEFLLKDPITSLNPSVTGL